MAEGINDVFPHAMFVHASKPEDFNLVALRQSENQFTGSRGTDTGNRLFNTTHLS